MLLIEHLSIVAGALSIMGAMSIFALSKIPRGARVPMQWGINGQPTWTAPRLLAVWFVPLLAAAVFAATAVAAHYGSSTVPLSVALIQAGVFALVHAIHLFLAVRHSRVR